MDTIEILAGIGSLVVKVTLDGRCFTFDSSEPVRSIAGLCMDGWLVISGFVEIVESIGDEKRLRRSLPSFIVDCMGVCGERRGEDRRGMGVDIN